MKKFVILAAGFIGYVLGTKAGRERYEQMKSQFDRLRGHEEPEFVAPEPPPPPPPASPSVTTVEE